jgi:hypothetical protein
MLFSLLPGPQPHIKWVPVVLSLAVKWPDREADYSPPPTANVMNAWSYTSTPLYVFMAATGGSFPGGKVAGS